VVSEEIDHSAVWARGGPVWLVSRSV